MKPAKLVIIAAAIAVAFCAQAAKELIDGYTWEYTVANGEATVTGVEPWSGNVTVPSKLAGYDVKSIGSCAFQYARGFASITISEGIETIESQAFWHTAPIAVIPQSVKHIGYFSIAGTHVDKWYVNKDVTFEYHTFQNGSVGTIYAYGDVFTDETLSTIVWDYLARYYCKRQYAKNWVAKFGNSKFCGYLDDAPEVEIVSAAVRPQEPTIMDVVYKVYSDAATVKVRAIAFQDGERSLAKAVPVKTLIEGTDANIGDAVTPNVEHKLSWRVSNDWSTDLSKVKFEVLAVEDDLLPLELQTIPATSTHPKMKISWNQMTSDKVFDALLWLYADGDKNLTLTNGQLKYGNDLLASGTGLYNAQSAVAYVFGKMGYQVLSGDDLTYARRVTQLDLPVGGVQQFAVKFPDAK